jgi:Ankyrin repeat.
VGGGHAGWWGLLLKRGADPDVGGQEGKKPLHIVAQLGRAELAELLIRYGAGPKTGDNNR